MHGPPAVTWEVRRSRWQVWIVVGLAICATLLLIGFVALQNWGVPSLVLLLALVAAIAFALSNLRSVPTGQLNWDGERWHWSGWEDGQSVTAVECMLDLQALVLVQLRRSPGTSQWLWLEWHAPGHHWAALRRALVSGPVGAPDGLGAEPSQDRPKRSS